MRGVSGGVWALGLLALAACGQPRTPEVEVQATGPVMVFPSRAALAAIAPKPVPPGAIVTDVSAVDAWAVPSTGASAGAADPWEEAARKVLGPARANRIAASLSCEARDTARFVAAQGGMPARDLASFIAGRCGVTHDTTSTRSLHVDAPSAVPLAKVIESFEAKLAELVQADALGPDTEIGVGFARDAKRAALVVSTGHASIDIDPAGLSVSNGAATLTGTLRAPVTNLMGIANQGAHGVERCVLDPQIAPPRFSMRCPYAASDPFAWVEIVAHRPGGLLLRSLASFIVAPGDRAALAYADPNAKGGARETDPAKIGEGFVAALNEARQAGGLPPLEHATAQSAANARLVGNFIDAGLDGDEQAASDISLGLLAGWDVPKGPIRKAGIFSLVIASADDPADLVRASLQLPLGRLVLLGKGTGLVAAGTSLVPDRHGAAVVATTYSIYESTDHTEEERVLRARIEGERRRLGLPLPAFLDTNDDVARQLADGVASGTTAPGEVLSRMLATVSEQTSQSTYGYVYELLDPSFAPIPPQLLRAEHSTIALRVTHRRAPGAAWGQLVAFFVVTTNDAVLRAAKGASVPVGAL